MAITVTTNIPSLVCQNNLTSATKGLNKSITRMSTGYKINSAADDAAGYAVATKMETDLSSTTICQDNVAMGESLLSTTGSNLEIIIDHFQRIRDLTEEAANGTYGSESIDAIEEEVGARCDEIDRLAASTEYNGIKLLNGDKATSGIVIQVGIKSDSNSQITLDKNIFKNANVATTTGKDKATLTDLSTNAKCTANLGYIDTALTDLTTRQTKVGAYQNRLESAGEALTVQYSNLSASLSTVKDADIAEESSNYVKYQILQQSSATLLTTANQSPSIALSLI